MSVGSIIDDSLDAVKKIAKGETVLHSNKAINAFSGPIELGGRLYRGEKFGSALEKTFKNAEGNLDVGKVAASALTVSAAGRFISGGGVYRDKNGNTNLIGVPFV